MERWANKVVLLAKCLKIPNFKMTIVGVDAEVLRRDVKSLNLVDGNHDYRAKQKNFHGSVSFSASVKTALV